MDFDRLTMALLVATDGGPSPDGPEADRLQDAHMAHLADLHDAGHLVAAGPLADAHYRGLVLLRGDPEEARRLLEADPAVRAGRFDVLVMGWMVPEGAMSFSPTRFPRSMVEVG